MADAELLPARLVATADKIHAGIVNFGRHTEDLLREAATRIEQLEAELRQRNTLRSWGIESPDLSRWDR